MQRGDVAPDFTLNDDTGAPRTLSALLDSGPVVLFFYPAAKTTGCTREACHFRDLHSEFSALGASVVGISMNEVERQADFARINGFTFPLLSDPGGAVARAYGVKRGLDLLKVRRTTFVIDPGRVVRDVFTSEVRMESHADRALSVLAG